MARSIRKRDHIGEMSKAMRDISRMLAGSTLFEANLKTFQTAYQQLPHEHTRRYFHNLICTLLSKVPIKTFRECCESALIEVQQDIARETAPAIQSPVSPPEPDSGAQGGK